MSDLRIGQDRAEWLRALRSMNDEYVLNLLDEHNARMAAPIEAALAQIEEWETYDSEGYAAGDGPDWWSRNERLRDLLTGGSDT